MIISACGTGYSGSGAVKDLLKEYEENIVMEFEFTLLYTPDGIADLDYHLNQQKFRYKSSDTAIRRFKRLVDFYSSGRSPYIRMTHNQFRQLSYDYINSLTQCSWRGTEAGDAIDLPWFQRKLKYSLLERLQIASDKITHKYFEIRPQREMALSIEPDGFYELTKSYMDKIFSTFCTDTNKNVVLDQFFPGNNPSFCYKYVTDPKGIVVYRDPRDLYILGKRTLLSKGRFMPLDNVETFVTYYQNVHKDILRQDNRTLVLRFEDLIFKYEETVKQIERFLSISHHISPKQYFDPSISIFNTALFCKYPEFDVDIRYIEEKLADWLYPFSITNELKKRGQEF